MTTSLRRLHILPCDESYAAMEPAAEGGRRCEHCACRVHDAGELSEAELDELLERSDTQRVCLRSELVGGRPRLAAGVAASVFVAALAGCAAPSSSFLIEAPELSFVELIELGGGSAESLAAGGVGVIGGVVTNLDGEPVDNAIVVLQSAALPETRERMTNARGIYVFKDLPEGNYTLQVLVGRANVSKVTSLPAGAKFRANFKLDPEASRVALMGVLVEKRRVPLDASSTYHSSLVWIED